MSQPWKPWSDNPYAPQIPYPLYIADKALLSGNSLGVILYGIVVILFFQCMNALFSSVNRKKGETKWVLVIHTVVMFLCATINTATGVAFLSISYIDNRGFPGNADGLGPGPYEFQLLRYSDPNNITSSIAFYLCQWLSDGLLLYRCCVIFAMNLLFIVPPCLIFLASVGAMSIYQLVRTDKAYASSSTFGFHLGISYYSIAFSLNIILTLMIITKLILHSRNIQSAMGGQAGAGRSYRAIVTMLIESSALCAVNFILFIGPWAVANPVAMIFLAMLPMTQVIAPLLIILRVANRSALTSEVIASGNISSIHFESRKEWPSGSETIADGGVVDSIDASGGDSSYEPGVGEENSIEEVSR